MDYKNASALDIFNNRHKIEAKMYFNELRKSVYRDMRDGKCQLIEALIVNPYRNANPIMNYMDMEHDIPLLAYYAIDDALNAVENNTGFPELGSGILTRYGSYGWNYFNNKGVDCIVTPLSMSEMKALTERYLRLCSASSQPAADYTPDNHTTGNYATVNYTTTDYTTAESGRNAAYSAGIGQKDDKARAKEKAEKIIRKAEQDAKARRAEADTHYNRCVEAARRKEDEILSAANVTAAQTRRDARDEAERTRREADTYATQTRNGANSYASQIRQQAENEAAERRRNAEAEAKWIIEEAQRKAAEEAEEAAAALIRQRLSGHIKELRQQWEEEQAEKSRQRDETAALAASLKDDICTVSTQVGASLNRDLEQLQEQLNQLRGNVIRDLQDWRTSLYQCEYGNLVNFYTTLNGFANSFERELREAECADNVPEEQKRILAEHSRKLNRLRANLINAMEPMGIRLFTPQKGELFNSYYHTINLEDNEDEDMFLDHEIQACLIPGIERVVNNQDVTVLRRAEVEVRKD